MNQVIIFAFFFLIGHIAVSQPTMTLSRYDSLMKINRSIHTPLSFPKVSCDTLYQRLTAYIHNKHMGVKASALVALTKLYQDTETGDSCSSIRTKITKDFLIYIQVDSLIDHRDFELSNLGRALSKDEILQLGGREIIVKVYQNRGLIGTPLSTFIMPFKLVELLPLYWNLFNKTTVDENGGSAKVAFLFEIIELGDSTGINLYKETLWGYTKSNKKIIDDPYFYQLLSRIQQLKNKEMVQQIFEILDYINTHQDKKIYIQTDSDTDKPTYWFLGQVLFSETLCLTVANLPKPYCQYPYPKYTKDNVETLLRWYRENPNRIILK